MKMLKAKIIFCSLLFFFLTLQINQLITKIQTSDLYYIVCDDLFSQQNCDEIKDFINQNLKNQKPRQLFENLKQKFPEIKSVIIQRNVPEILQIKVFAYEPKFLINNNLVFAQGKIFQNVVYNSNVLKQLNNIEIKLQINEDVIDFLNKLPSTLAQDFNITWLNKNNILLDSNADQLQLIVKHDFIPDVKYLNLCKKLKTENNKCKKLDLRFSKQIVLCQN